MRPLHVPRAAAALAAVLTLGVGLRLSLLNVDDYMPKADEGFYLRYAVAAAREGASLPGLADAYLANAKWQLSPSPLRVGHILLSSAWMRLEGRFDFQSLSRLSCLFSILTLLLGWHFARRLFGSEIALATAALLAVSPLSLALGRRALQDAEIAFFVLASLYAFRETLRGRSLAPPLLLAASFFLAIVCKESSILLLAFFLLWLAAERLAFDRREGVREALAAVLIAPAAASLFMAWAVGGPAKLWRLAQLVVLSQQTNPYVLKYQSGSIFRYLEDFFLVSPWVLVLAAALLPAAARRRRPDRRDVLFLAAFFAAAYAAYSGFARNLRYVLALDFPLRTLAVLSVWSWTASTPCSPAARTAVRVLLVLTLAAGDLFVFHRLFLRQKIYDPVTVDLLEGWGDLLGIDLG